MEYIKAYPERAPFWFRESVIARALSQPPGTPCLLMCFEPEELSRLVQKEAAARGIQLADVCVEGENVTFKIAS